MPHTFPPSRHTLNHSTAPSLRNKIFTSNLYHHRVALLRLSSFLLGCCKTLFNVWKTIHARAAWLLWRLHVELSTSLLCLPSIRSRPNIILSSTFGLRNSGALPLSSGSLTPTLPSMWLWNGIHSCLILLLALLNSIATSISHLSVCTESILICPRPR